MKKNTLLTGILMIAALGIAIVIDINREVVVEKAPLETYSSDEFHVSFSYPEYYELSARDIDRANRVHHQVVLIDEAEAGREASEGPTSISLDIFQNNLDNLSARQFITGSSNSNYKLGDGVIATSTYGTLEGLEYQWSGLYEGRSFVVSRPDYIYMFSVTRLDPTDRIIADFDRMLETVEI